VLCGAAAPAIDLLTYVEGSMRRVFSLVLVTGVILSASACEKRGTASDAGGYSLAQSDELHDFTYKVRKKESSGGSWYSAKWEIVFTNAPPFVHPLRMAPPAREQELSQGTWLVMASGVFSQTDVNCIGVAVRCLAPYGGKIKLGVRPFCQYEEMLSWFPDYRDEHASPLWIVFKNGKVLAWDAGDKSQEKLNEFIKRTLLQD
jgi:hypothetical protein